ncbi:hypothetical protein ACIQAC_37550 [Streptomyces sp. NPDC088387]|uniref:hypothetical protein n=1 Tax=Streptomyces sp. NPDC088387 TaxID=3365859 RepID=UPI0038127F1D
MTPLIGIVVLAVLLFAAKQARAQILMAISAMVVITGGPGPFIDAVTRALGV